MKDAAELAALYKENRFMLGVPAVSPSSGRVVGLVFAVTEISAINNMWRAFAGLFFMTSIVVLMLAFVASSVVVHAADQAHSGHASSHPSVCPGQL